MDPAELRRDGAVLERKHHKDVAELVATCARRMVIAGHDVPAASIPYTMASDAGAILAQGEHFAACYYDTAHTREFSLRSHATGVDVSVVAGLYGGGGHARAAGFRVPRAHELARA
jgi:oligoribonuclease NrnB/cAMP/cGMP phosphodiesterase (DHH superfamily)